MKQVTKTVEDINLMNFSWLFLKINKPLVIMIIVSILLPLPLFLKLEVAFLTVQQFTLIISLLISFMLHEYFHILSFKILKKKGAVRIESTLLRISIIPLFHLSNYQIVMMAMMGPLICFTIGLILFMTASSQLMMYVSYIFLLHIIFLLPPFGDGMMIIKAYLSSQLKGGE